MNELNIEKAYGEMARMCSLILSVISSDIHDGMTKVHRFHEHRFITKNEAEKLLHLTNNYEVSDQFTAKQHAYNIHFFAELTKKICACPPEGISFSYVKKLYFER